jgi:hypothetical protein
MPVPRSPRPQNAHDDRPSRLRRQLAEAITHLHRLVDHQDDPCDFDHHGQCQTHSTDGSEPGKCGVAEARAWLAEHDPAAG